MAESANVRLVRCPKCENLLPELADYSVYQCGGCGAVLKAKKRNSESDTLSEKSDEDRVGGVSRKSDNFSEEEIPQKAEKLFHKGIGNLSDASETDARSNGSSSARDKNKKVLSDCDGGRVMTSEKYEHLSEVTVDKLAAEDDLPMKMGRDELGNANIGTEYEELKAQVRNASMYQRLGQTSKWTSGERGKMDGFRKNWRAEAEGMRFSTSNYPDEGPSGYYSDSRYGGYEKTLKSHNDLDGSNRVEYIEQDRAELLRKLDELKDQLSRSGNMVEKTNEKVPPGGRMFHQEPYAGHGTWFPHGATSSSGTSMQFFAPDKHVTRPPYYDQYPEPYPFPSRREMATHNFYPTMHTSHQIPGYDDPVRSQMLGRALHKAPGQYQQQPSHPYYSGHYMDADLNPFEPYPPNPAFHHPSCSCFRCYDKHRLVPPRVPPTAFDNKTIPDVPNNPTFYNHQNASAFGPQGYNVKIVNPPHLSSHDPGRHSRLPSDVNSSMDGFIRCRPQTVVLANGGRRCYPIIGGAPFITCYNCFELLQLPRKVSITDNNQQKMQCGACSTVFYYAVVDKKIVVSIHPDLKQTVRAIDNRSDEVINRGTFHSRGHMNRDSMNSCSDDFDSSGYDFQFIDREPVSSSTGQDFNSSKTQETHSLHSSSLSSSEDEDCRNGLIAEREVSNSVDLPKKATLSPPPPGSPLKDYFDYSSNNHAINQFGKGNQSNRSDQEKAILKKVTSRQNSIKDASVATEMEVSFNEYSNTGISHDSGDTSREEEQPKIKKGGESFFAGIIKKSFRSNQTVEDGKVNVKINGHPISDNRIKKAEKLAGPINPGEYWYDVRAGFWGVMGGPCLGIIPPYIEEFNYPIPEDCAGGDTGVFVNGRELHQKDLDLLSSRGLPTDGDRSYIIDISGRVLDEDTGEELDCLGRLAPTVEKFKHGFGMKVRAARQ